MKAISQQVKEMEKFKQIYKMVQQLGQNALDTGEPPTRQEVEAVKKREKEILTENS